MATLVDMIVKRIREDIFHGALAPGKHLKQYSIAYHYGVSTVPVRQALLLLQADGLIEHTAYCGARVTLLNQNEAIELADIRNALDIMAHQLAVHTLNDHVLSSLENATDAMQETYNHTTESLIECMHNYHTVLLSQSNRPLLLNQIYASLKRIARYYAEFMRSGYKLLPLLPDHSMVTALRHGDKELLAACLHRWHEAHLAFADACFQDKSQRGCTCARDKAQSAKSGLP